MEAKLVRRNPEVLSGALCFAGTRVPVKNLFDDLEASTSLTLRGPDHRRQEPALPAERAQPSQRRRRAGFAVVVKGGQ